MHDSIAYAACRRAELPGSQLHATDEDVSAMHAMSRVNTWAVIHMRRGVIVHALYVCVCVCVSTAVIRYCSTTQVARCLGWQE